MLNDVIEVLTKQMIEKDFQLKKANLEEVVKIRKVDLYKFCIKLIKLIKEIYEED